MGKDLRLEVARGVYFHGMCIFCQEVFFRMHLPLSMEVYNILSIDSLDFMVVDDTMKHLLGLTQPNIQPVALISALTHDVLAG